MVYMTGAYLVIWAAAFVFILSMVRRQAKIDSELQSLRETMADRDGHH